MGIKTVPHASYRPELAPSDFCLFPKLRGCRYETIEEIKEAVTKVIDTLIQEDFDGAFQELLERYNKCIATGGDYFERDQSFMNINKSAHTKTIWKLIVCTSYNTIQSDSETPGLPELWGMQSTPLLPLLTGTLSPRVVAPEGPCLWVK